MWQVYPARLGVVLRKALRHSLLGVGCLLLAYMVHLCVMDLGPSGAICFETSGGGGDVRGWPFACAVAGTGEESTRWGFFWLDVLFYFVIITPLCYLLVGRSIRKG